MTNIVEWYTKALKDATRNAIVVEVDIEREEVYASVCAAPIQERATLTLTINASHVRPFGTTGSAVAYLEALYLGYCMATRSEPNPDLVYSQGYVNGS